MNVKQPVEIWEYKYAPYKYRNCFIPCDCDWIMFVPNGQDVPDFIDAESGSRFGCCDVNIEEIETGTLYAGYHA